MAHRLHGMSATSISTNGLDMDRHTLAHKIQEGCEGRVRELLQLSEELT
jgi:hypothetical protein